MEVMILFITSPRERPNADHGIETYDGRHGNRSNIGWPDTRTSARLVTVWPRSLGDAGSRPEKASAKHK
jgi:prepilin-type processing-associated H-X9-DG protein